MDNFKVELTVVYGRKMPIIKISGFRKQVRGCGALKCFPLYAVSVKTYLEHYVQLLAPQFKKDAKVIF